MSFIKYLSEQQALDEMAINPSSLNRFLDSDIASKMTLGIEAEMCMPVTEHKSNRDDVERRLDGVNLDHASDLKEVYSIIKDAIDDVVDGYYESDRIDDELDEVFKEDGVWFQEFYAEAEVEYFNTFEEKVYDEYEVNGKTVINDIFNEKLDEYITDEDGLSDDDITKIKQLYADAIDEVIQDRKWVWYGIRFASSSSQREFKEYLNAHQIGNYSTQVIFAIMANMDDDLEAAMDEMKGNSSRIDFEDWFEEEHGQSILKQWFDDVGVTTVMDFLKKFIDNNEIDMILDARPSNSDFSDGGSSAEYYAEELQSVVNADVGVNQTYHGHNTDRLSDWTLEPDGSINPDDDDVGIEFISPPMHGLEYAMEQIEELFNFLNRHGGYNNESTGFHINLSLPFSIQKKVDLLKLMLLLGDQHVLASYGRENNTYAQSSLGKAKQMMASRSNANEIIAVLDSLRETLVDNQMVADKNTVRSALGNAFGEMAGSKFVSINVKNDTYIEFRSAGGQDYVKNWDKIRLTILRFAYVLSVAADVNAEKQEYMKKLYKFVQDALGKSDDPIIGKFVQYVSLSAGRTPEEIAKLREQLKKLLVIKKELKGGKETPEQWVNRIVNTKEADFSKDDLEILAGDLVTPLTTSYRDALMKKLPSIDYGRIVYRAWSKLHPS